MFGLFKRSKTNDWEIPLMLNTIEKLPNEYSILKTQIEVGLITGVLEGLGDIKGYVAFKTNPAVYDRYENRKAKYFEISGLKVWDNKSSRYYDYKLYVISGVINGYSINSNEKKLVIDPGNIIGDYKIVHPKFEDYEKICDVLTASERDMIDSSDVYIVNLEGKEYFHLKDLEGGDFISVDKQHNFYKITHDPYEIKLLDGNPEEFLS